LNRFWNYRILGVFTASMIIFKVALLTFYEIVSTFFWKFNLAKGSSPRIVQYGTEIRNVKNVFFGENVSIGRYCQIFTEFQDSRLTIGNNSQINTKCQIDFSGDVKIGENVVISEESILMSHDHGYDPKSIPVKCPKLIEDNVWIGSRSLILPKVKVIGENSIVAAGSVVTKDVPKNVVVAGNPAKIIKTLS
jgi:acetyltransferase-like isoleucine patch superfamily enzyme